MMKNQIDKSKGKYNKMLSASELQFLDYREIVSEKEFEYVYKPNDDSFMMLSVLKQESLHFPSDSIICELGSGSGVISAHLNSWLKGQPQEPLLHVSIDVNLDASQISSRYYQHYQLNIQQINTSLFKNTIFGQNSSKIQPSIIIFNPPYVPVEQEELDNEQFYLKNKLKHIRDTHKCVQTKDQNLIAFSYMGGLDGLDITRKIIKLIHWACVFYFIVMGEEGISILEHELQNGMLFDNQIGLQYKLELMQFTIFQNEHLFLLKMTFYRQ